jgi:hypothetical protein
MPKFIKHVGQISDSGKKCVVVFRMLPGEDNSCLVVETEKLAQQYHDNLMEAVESLSSQAEMDFYKFAQRSSFFDGRNMLEALHLSGWLTKQSCSNIIMMPTNEIKIGLNELNAQLVNLEDNGKTTSASINQSDEPAPLNSKQTGVLDDQAIANQMRSQAAFFRKEAERLLTEAEALNPISSPVVSTTSELVETPAPKVKRAYSRKKSN